MSENTFMSDTTPAPMAAAEDSHQDDHKVPYFLIWGYLLALTVVEVVFPSLVPRNALFFVAMILMAVVKVILVAWFFMHLKFEKRTLLIVAAAPMIFAMVLVMGLVPDGTKAEQAATIELQENE